MTTSQSLLTINNNNQVNFNNSSSNQQQQQQQQNTTTTTTTTTTIIPEFKHCECKNAKELIQLIRSDAIESVQVSWPDDMGLWYSSVIKSCEVSLQNLVEGIKLSGQLLFVDPTSARFDLSKKQKTILVRCSLNNNNNNNTYTTSSGSCNNNNNNNNLTINSLNNSRSQTLFTIDDNSGDGEVAKSPPSKFSLLLDESEKSRKYISTNQTQTLNENHPPSLASSISLFGNNNNNNNNSMSINGTPPFVYVSSPPSSTIISSSNNGPGGLLQQQQQLNSLDSLSPTSSSISTSPLSLKGSVAGGCNTFGYQTLKKTQSIQPPKSFITTNTTTNGNSNNNNNTSLSPSSTTLNISTTYKDSVLGKRVFEDSDSLWLEEIRNGSTVEIVPDLTNPLLSLCGSSGGLGGNSLSSPLSSSDSSPGLPNNDDSSGETDLTNIDSAERAILEGQIPLPPILRPRQYHACKIPKEDRPNKRRKNHTSLFCRHCGTTDTPEWRRGPDGRKSLCNACGLHYSKLVKKENMAVPQLSRSFDISDLLNPTDKVGFNYT